jgi:hypothetical protein
MLTGKSKHSPGCTSAGALADIADMSSLRRATSSLRADEPALDGLSDPDIGQKISEGGKSRTDPAVDDEAG